eukprot:CAMPEP_0116978514 /NCGR_PEP_ID=MMETSP0467-20121206/57834_1 /TAXON_ID=283647 /ORGANISM="Mesodinium pulex, Strain SPMC105" /LENGTH=66 /DNA_ID=CAMNT_0004671913 /DNA_START=578 /DNA_END=778 /DNA_ORIENTATION=-
MSEANLNSNANLNNKIKFSEKNALGATKELMEMIQTLHAKIVQQKEDIETKVSNLKDEDPCPYCIR